MQKITKPLIDRGIDGVEDSLAVLKEYRLLREDIESLIELSTWPGKKSPMDAVEGKVKAALTRAYNKEVTPYSYSATVAVKKKKQSSEDALDQLDEGYNEEENYSANKPSSCNSSDEEDEDLNNDVLIKAKKKTEAPQQKKKATGSSAGNAGKKASKGSSKVLKTKSK